MAKADHLYDPRADKLWCAVCGRSAPEHPGQVAEGKHNGGFEWHREDRSPEMLKHLTGRWR